MAIDPYRPTGEHPDPGASDGAVAVAALALSPLCVLGAPAEGIDALAVGSLAVDSRRVAAGAMFFALCGVARHGADHALQAVAAGATAVATDLEGAERIAQALAERGGGADWPAPVIVLAEPRRALALAAARFHGAPPERLAAVTGTNGKTSVARFAQQIWTAQGRPAASFGTAGIDAPGLGPGGGDLREPLSHTTPEPITLHALLARLAGLGAQAAALEASSHALAQHRLDGAPLSAAAFTNLSRDHLDYHRDAHDYAAAKLRLFAELLPAGAAAAINVDDALGPLACAIARARGARVIEVGRAARDGGVRIVSQTAAPDGVRARLALGAVEREVALPLYGAFQSDNAALAAAMTLGADGCETDPAAAEAAFAALQRLRTAPGRMELAARRSNGARVFVDYAHTPAAVAAAIAALRPHAPSGRIGVVLGAGGDRDRGKRAPMGAAAATADFAIITDDNPRSEDPAAIRAQVWAGLGARADRATEIGDRAEAILAGVDALEPGDALLVAGKGHETGQIVAGDILPFDDRSQARAAVAALDGIDF